MLTKESGFVYVSAVPTEGRRGREVPRAGVTYYQLVIVALGAESCVLKLQALLLLGRGMLGIQALS